MFAYGKIRKKFHRRADLFVILLVLVTAAFFALAGKFLSSPGDSVVVEQDGEEIYCIPLAEETRTLRLKAPGGGYNILEIDNESVRILEADCPDQICVKQGFISRGGQTILCLPHRLCIYIRSNATEALDAVSQ